jgi:spermidine synthase
MASTTAKKSAPRAQAGIRPGLMLGTYGAAIFLSAGLLFAVQPLFTKIVLPYLGGSPSVWSVAMVFFQATLLAGYLYAHLLTKNLPGPRSAVVHLLVMLAATLFLPLSMAAGWGRPPTAGTEFWLIGLFLVSIGLPFFALSANAPLLQAWFARTGHPAAKDPYFLYAASNIGSFIALLGYPLLAEPFTRLGEQTRFWSYLFYLLIALIALCGFVLARSKNALPVSARGGREASPTARDALIWIALAAVPSAFLVAVTAHISTDVASAPLLWVGPLALYLLTFVLVFQTKRIIPHGWFVTIQPYAILLLISVLVFEELGHIGMMILINLAAFFITAMVCHGELAKRRPAATHLTAFYLWMSVGGVIGGIAAGLVAPNVFNWVTEYPILMIAGLLCRPGMRLPDRGEAMWLILGALLLSLALLSILKLGVWPKLSAFNGMIGILLLLAALYFAWQPVRLAATFGAALVLVYAYHWEGGAQTTVRSFFGVNKVYDNLNGQYRVLMHGTTIHGVQRVRDVNGQPISGRPETISYFSSRSPMAIVFEATKQNKSRPVRVAVVGLGIGTVACFMRPEDRLDFFEIDPVVVRIATDPSRFTMISSCKPDASIVIGDARLTLQDTEDGFYDLIVMDAFSSDAVPVHLLTREAMALYLKKLAPGGMVVSHVMNRHMELPSVVAGIAAANGMITRVMHSFEFGDAGAYIYGSSVAAVARSDKDFGRLLDLGNWEMEPPDPRQSVWTDDYSNIVGAMLRHYRQ